MPYHLWRIPPVLGVMACCALLLFAAAVLLWIAVRRRSTPAKAVAAATFGLLALLTRIPIRAMAAEIARAYQVDIVYAEPSRLSYLLPVLFAGFIYMVGKWVLQDRWVTWRALWFYTWLVAFASTNVYNFCTPGYCGWIGFPFPWLTWSDAVLTFGEPFAELVREIIGAAIVIFAAVVDSSIFILVSAVLVRPQLLRRPA